MTVLFFNSNIIYSFITTTTSYIKYYPSIVDKSQVINNIINIDEIKDVVYQNVSEELTSSVITDVGVYEHQIKEKRKEIMETAGFRRTPPCFLYILFFCFIFGANNHSFEYKFKLLSNKICPS